MDHVVYLDHKAKELDHLKAGIKTMILRGAMGRKLPYGRVNPGDTLYFIENKGDGLVKAKALVDDVVNTEKLDRQASIQLVNDHQDSLRLNDGLLKRFGGKRYLVLISVKNFCKIDPFKIDRSAYDNMDDWLPVEDIERVRIEGPTSIL